MGARQKTSQSGRGTSRGGGTPKRKTDEAGKDHSQTRRELYRRDAGYREKVKQNSRKTYRRNNPKGENPLAERKPLTEPVLKSLTPMGQEEPFNDYSYTLNQTAAALGKAQLTFKKWVNDKMVPEPIIVDTSHGYQQYLWWEVEAMLEPIADHFDHFDYLHNTHTDTINAIWSAVNEAREEKGDGYYTTQEKEA